MTSTRYEQLTLDDGNEITLLLTEEGDGWLQGWEVQRGGRRETTFGANWAEIERLHWIDKRCIRTRIALEQNDLEVYAWPIDAGGPRRIA